MELAEKEGDTRTLAWTLAELGRSRWGLVFHLPIVGNVSIRLR